MIGAVMCNTCGSSCKNFDSMEEYPRGQRRRNDEIKSDISILVKCVLMHRCSNMRILHKSVNPLLVSYVGSNPILFHHKSNNVRLLLPNAGYTHNKYVMGIPISGCSSIWSECCIWDAEVAGSSPVTPIIICPNSKVQVLLRTL